MSLRRGLFALLGLLAGANAGPSFVSKTIRSSADKVVARAPPLPTTTLVTDFQKDGVNSSWAEGHPKAWGSEATRFKGPFVADVSPDEKFLALASGIDLTIRNLDSLDVVSTAKSEFQGVADGITFAPDRDGGYNVFVEFLNYTVGHGVTVFHLSPEGVITSDQKQYHGKFSSFDGRDGPFSLDYRRVLVIDNYQVVIHDLDNPESEIALIGHTNPVMSAAFSPDGTLVSTASWDSYGKVWNASTGDLIHSFGPSGGQNWKTNFSPDGKYVTVSNAGKQPALNIWPVSDMSAEPIAIKNFGNWIRTASWTSDSKLLAAGSYGIIQVYSMDEQKVIQRWESEDLIYYETWDLFWVEDDDSGLKLAYRTNAGLEVYDFEANLKYRWGPDAYAQYDGSASGDATNAIRSKGWLGGREADGSIRFYDFPF